ncbi:MAG: hypothetical protein M1835_005126 [Candelina submexicana]|nr:MAG: hypothetical protein M1835_005126 [Candelina submexicana]
MAASRCKKDNYKTPFYCALCGLPFARVLRTDKQQNRDDQYGVAQWHQGSSVQTIPEEENSLLSCEEVQQLLGADDCLELKLREPQYTRSNLEEHKVRRAYEGHKITGEHLEWIGSLRALIHRFAKAQPEGGRDQLEGHSDVYLTGRGRVAEDASWAYAAPAIDTEIEDVDTGWSIRRQVQYGFHLYQEPERNDRRFFYSSIPFHDQCWDILDLAVQFVQERKGMPDLAHGEGIDLDHLWTSLVSVLPTVVPRKLSDLSTEAFRHGVKSDAITGLPQSVFVGPEVKQCAGRNGWLHIEGLEVGRCVDSKLLLVVDQFKWLVADPSTSLLLNQPFSVLNVEGATNDPLLPLVRNGQVEDPFFSFPQELVHEVMELLSCREVFRWRQASVAIGQITIPSREYRRFVREEYAFLPQLRKKSLENTSRSEVGCHSWKQVFSYVSMACRRDESLRSRRRIWNAVLPVADELVETSLKNLALTFYLEHENSCRTRVRRGYVGAMSGAEGSRQTLTFAAIAAEPQAKPSSEKQLTAGFNGITKEQSLQKKEQNHVFGPSHLVRAVKSIVVWLDPNLRHICGVEFCFIIESPLSGAPQELRKRVGTSSTLRECYINNVLGQVLLGFKVCWYDACLQGLQFIFRRTDDARCNESMLETVSERYGSWGGPTRRLVVDPSVSRLAGFTTFFNNSGKIESLAILEQDIVENDDQTLSPEMRDDVVPLSHQEASVWATLPPDNVDMLERAGPFFKDWKIKSADWHIFGRHSTRYASIMDDIGSSSSLGDVEKLEGFCLGDYLSGLSFTHRVGKRVSETKLGACEGTASNVLYLKEGDNIVAVIIGHGSLGIHSIQIITTSANVTFGKRYLGEHIVYVTESARPCGEEMIGDFVYLNSEVIGFHCVYQSELRRFLQLGLICQHVSPQLGSQLQSPPPNSCNEENLNSGSEAERIVLPFTEADEHKNTWVDGPPPESYFPTFRCSDSLMQLPTAPQGIFAGWISFDEPISSITTFGDMNGIIFSYSDPHLADRCFGHTERALEEHIQVFTSHEKQITAIAIEDTNSGSARPCPNDSLQRIKFLTGTEMRKDFLNVEVESEHLAGMQFFFTATCLVHWDPLLKVKASLGTRQLGGGNSDAFFRDPVVKTASAPQPFELALLRKYRHLAKTFRPGEPVDGIIGFTTLNGRFCGLLFRRNGIWDETPLGQASKQEMKFLLQPNEELSSMTIWKMKCANVVDAVAV